MVMRMILSALWHLMALATGPVPIKALFLEKIRKHQMTSSSQFSLYFYSLPHSHRGRSEVSDADLVWRTS